MLVAFLLVIGAAFYLVAFSTIRLVGDALFDDTIRAHMNKVRTLSVTLGERVVGRGRNRREAGKSALAHAELEAIAEACRTLGGWRLWQAQSGSSHSSSSSS